MRKLKCSNCGHENLENSTVCAECGADLAAGDAHGQTMSFSVPSEVLEDEKAVVLSVAATDHPIMVAIKGLGVRETYPLKKEVMSIGRDPESDIFLDDITVSRNHAELKIDDIVSIKDVGSLNGTYVNRVAVENEELNDRDEVQIGKFKLVFLAKRAHREGSGDEER